MNQTKRGGIRPGWPSFTESRFAGYRPCSADTGGCGRMARLTALIILTWVGATAASPQEAPKADTADYVTVEARYVADPEPALAFTVRSKHREPFSMSDHDLPWGNDPRQLLLPSRDN